VISQVLITHHLMVGCHNHTWIVFSPCFSDFHEQKHAQNHQKPQHNSQYDYSCRLVRCSTLAHVIGTVPLIAILTEATRNVIIIAFAIRVVTALYQACMRSRLPIKIRHAFICIILDVSTITNGIIFALKQVEIL
jgi:hypothetical protein